MSDAIWKGIYSPFEKVILRYFKMIILLDAILFENSSQNKVSKWQRYLSVTLTVDCPVMCIVSLDALDSMNNKQAIQLADKILKKQKDLHCAKVPMIL